jgi:hypothetical protein
VLKRELPVVVSVEVFERRPRALQSEIDVHILGLQYLYTKMFISWDFNIFVENKQ